MNTQVSETPNPEIPRGFMKSRDGSLTPKDKVKPVDKKRDEVVRAIIKKGKDVSNTLAGFKQAALVEISDFVDWSAAEYGAKAGGAKGNLTLYTYDGEYKIEVAISENKAFDERLQAARTLIDECLKEWMKGSNKNIQALVQDAFKTNKQGHVSVERLFALRRLEIKDERWLNAMDAIADSVQSIGS